jgi:hypothetical protein
MRNKAQQLERMSGELSLSTAMHLYGRLSVAAPPPPPKGRRTQEGPPRRAARTGIESSYTPLVCRLKTVLTTN